VRPSLSRDIERKFKTISKERYDRFISDRAWQVITSAAEDQKALDSSARRGKASDGKHSPFAQALFDALRGGAKESADGNKDGIIIATELYCYLRNKVETATEEHYKRQTPGLCPLKKHQNGEFIFLLPDFDRDNLENAPRLNPGNNPYRGLQSYDQKHSELFHGRSKLIDKLCAHVTSEEQAFTVILGASGTGKSSLMKAGLLSRLAKDHKYTILEMRVGDSPLTALAQVLPITDGTAVTLQKLKQHSQAFVDIIQKWKNTHPDAKLLLAIDQFEELITLRKSNSNQENKTVDGKTEQDEFQEFLKQAIEQCKDCFDVVVTLRLDFEAQFQEGILKDFWESARFVVPPMTQDELREAIEKPASEKVLYFEPPSLVDDLINEVIQMPGGLPLLSFTLSELYLKYVEERRDNRALTYEDYKALGKVIGSVTKRTDEEYNALVEKDKAYKKTVRQVMLRMVAVGDEARRRVLLSELEYPDEKENNRAKELIKRFCEARLLVQGTNSEGKPYVEPAHDALIQNWQELKNWKNESEANPANTSETNPANPSEANPANPSEANPANPSETNPANTSGANPANPSGANPANPSETNPANTSGTNPANSSGTNLANISGVAFSHDNKLLATLIERRDAQNNPTTTVKLWDIKQGKCIPRNIANTPLGQEGQPPNNPQTTTSQKNQPTVPIQNNQLIVPIKDIAFSPDENLIATVGQNNTVRLWDISGKKLGEFPTAQRNIYSLAFTPDGKLATSGNESTIKLWTIQNNGSVASLTSKKPDEIKTEQTILYNIAFSPDGKRLATLGEDNIVRLKDISWQSTIKRILGNQIVAIPPIKASSQTITATNAAFSPDGKKLATIAGDNTVKLWDTFGKQIARFQTGEGDAKSVAFSPDGNFLVTGGADGKVSLWDTSGEEIDTISLPDLPACDDEDDEQTALEQSTDDNEDSSSNSVTRVVFASIDIDGENEDEEDEIEDDQHEGLITILEDGTLRFLPIQEGKFKKTSSDEFCTEPFPRDLGLIKGVATSPDGEQVAFVGKDDDTINLWEESSNQPQQLPIQKIGDETFTSVAFSPDEKLLAIASAAENETGLVRVWDISQNRIIEQFDTLQGKISSVAFSPLDSRQLITGGEDGTVRVWDLSSNAPAQIYTEQGTIKSMEFNPNRELLATISKNNQLKLWDIRDDGTLRLNPASEKFPQQQGGVKSVTFNPNGNKLIIVGGDDNVKLWNISNNQFEPLATQQQQIQTVVASPDKQKLATIGKDSLLKLWHLQEGKFQSTGILNSQLGQPPISSLAFSSDGKQLATGQGNILKLWKLSLGKPSDKPFDQFQTQQPIQSVAFSPNGKKVATGENQGVLKLWDKKGNLLDQLPTQQTNINRLVFSPDSNLIATIGQDSTLKLWDTSDKSDDKLTQISTRVDRDVENVAFSQDGKFLAIGRNNGSIELRQVGDVDNLKGRICSVLGDYFQNHPDRQLCDGIALSIERRMSRGDKLLVPSVTNPDKQSGVQAIASGNFPATISDLENAFEENRNDPEALIYLNNARIGTQKSYLIAVSVPLESNENGALEVLRGVAQAQDEINRKGGINGVPLRVFIANDNNDPKVGKQIAQELSKNPDVLGVVGHFASDVTLAAGKVYQANKLAAISPVSTSTQWLKPHWYSGQYIFRTAPNDDTTATTLADSMLNKLQQKNAIVFYNSQSQYSESLKSAFSDAVRSAGGRVLQADLSDPNFDAQQQVQESTQQGAKVLVLLLDREEIDKAIDIIKQKRGNQIILAGDAFYGTRLLEVAQEEENVKDMMIAVPWHISNSQSNFAQTSRQLWWADVSWRTALSYDATQALIAALNQNPTRQGVAQALRSETFSIDGATGKVQFLPSGDRANPLSQLVKIEPGSRSGYDYDFVLAP
jgi:WD40 repeat protein